MLPAGSFLKISQVLGISYMVISDIGYMCRIDAKDADALGMTPPAAEDRSAQENNSMKRWHGIS